MDIELKRGKILVISGPQGSGKTILARKIAENYGAFRELDAVSLNDTRELDHAIASGVATIIFDEAPCAKEIVARLKDIVTNPTVTVNRKYQEPVSVATPNFIICTSGDQHFLVVTVEHSGPLSPNP